MKKNEVVYVSPTVHVPNKLSIAIKCHRYDIETRRYSSAIDLHMQVHSTEAHVKFYQDGSQEGIKTYSEQ